MTFKHIALIFDLYLQNYELIIIASLKFRLYLPQKIGSDSINMDKIKRESRALPDKKQEIGSCTRSCKP